MHLTKLAAQPSVPSLHSFPCGSGQLNHFDLWIDLFGVGDRASNIEFDVRQQINFVQDHQFAGAKHVRIFQRFVFAFGDGQDDYFGALAQIEERRANQVADVFDKQQRVRRGSKTLKSAPQHIGFQMTASAGIDLHRLAAGGANAFGIVDSFLIAFDDADINLTFQIKYRLFQQRRLA